jgi:hypothetical protein
MRTCTDAMFLCWLRRQSRRSCTARTPVICNGKFKTRIMFLRKGSWRRSNVCWHHRS